ncbi:uncharacterized protein LOC113003201 [Solenopsis invicta]|uniref:uncharacterized protein LOC113003201 n=1 Tax=Solenopsis invicta TaxID=13686 RepID=UPI00193C8D03|nr:uncharacterized protein LOC113003201 [Solenopsis invicta]
MRHNRIPDALWRFANNILQKLSSSSSSSSSSNELGVFPTALKLTADRCGLYRCWASWLIRNAPVTSDWRVEYMSRRRGTSTSLVLELLLRPFIPPFNSSLPRIFVVSPLAIGVPPISRRFIVVGPNCGSEDLPAEEGQGNFRGSAEMDRGFSQLDDDGFTAVFASLLKNNSSVKIRFRRMNVGINAISCIRYITSPIENFSGDRIVPSIAESFR